jgi:colanic acid/amylovoran biosynthesis glycosyltransferase
MPASEPKTKEPLRSEEPGNTAVRIAYLVNQYPTTSHSFIRREILALEEQGAEVDRYSIRSTDGRYVDAQDAKEAAKTTVLLGNWSRMMGAVGRIAAKNPARFANAVGMSHRFACQSDRGLVPHAAYLAEACVLLEHLQANRVEHLHAHFGTNSAAVAALCRVLGGPPYSFTVHGPEEFDRAAVLSLGEKISGASFVVAISEYGRSQLYRLVERQHWDKICIVRCGLQKDLLERVVTPVSGNNRFVCVGRLHEQKGQFILLDAARALKARGLDFRITLVGDGPLRSEMQTRINALGLSEEVRIAGWLTEQQVIGELEESAALVLPSFAEGLPVVIMEAFALGRPVVSTYVAGIPELVEPGVNGWLVPAGSVEALAQCMSDVMATDNRTLSEMGGRGKTAVQVRHDIARSGARLLDLMKGEKLP